MCAIITRVPVGVPELLCSAKTGKACYVAMLAITRNNINIAAFAKEKTATSMLPLLKLMCYKQYIVTDTQDSFHPYDKIRQEHVHQVE